MRLTSTITTLLLALAGHITQASASDITPGRSTVTVHRAAAAGLRPMAPWIAQLLADARPLSPTLDGLIRRIEASRIIVHVVESDDAAAAFDGRIYFVGAAGPFRYLRVALRRLAPAVAAAVLAHELQHALEIAAAGVSSRAEFEGLYRRIGVGTVYAHDVHFDTPAAVAAGRTAIRELMQRPVRRMRLTAP